MFCKNWMLIKHDCFHPNRTATYSQNSAKIQPSISTLAWQDLNEIYLLHIQPNVIIKYSKDKQTQKWKKCHISIDPYNLQSQIPCTLTFKASSVCFGSFVLRIFLVHMQTSTAHQSRPVLFLFFFPFYNLSYPENPSKIIAQIPT